MDITKIILELRNELEQIDDAIRALERLRLGSRRRPGRPPKLFSAAAPRRKPEEIRSIPAHAQVMTTSASQLA